MKILGQRIIEFLKADSTLVSLLGSSTNIFAQGVLNRKDKYITVSVNVGDDLDYIDCQQGLITIGVIVNTSIANNFKICMDITERVNDILNKKEQDIENSTWAVLSMVRAKGNDGILLDDKFKEIMYYLDFEYYLNE